MNKHSKKNSLVEGLLRELWGDSGARVAAAEFLAEKVKEHLAADDITVAEKKGAEEMLEILLSAASAFRSLGVVVDRVAEVISSGDKDISATNLIIDLSEVARMGGKDTVKLIGGPLDGFVMRWHSKNSDGIVWLAGSAYRVRPEGWSAEYDPEMSR